MKNYIGKRLIGLIPVVFGLSFIVFFCMYAAPGDAASKLLASQGIAVDKTVIEDLRVGMGLNRSFFEQYFSWLFAVLRGDLGLSFVDSKPVLVKLLKASTYTLILASSSLTLALIISLPLGFICAVSENKFSDHVIKLFSFISNAMPNFLISILLIYFFSIKLKIFPVIAKKSIIGLTLPTLSLALPISGRFIRQIRAEVLSELDKSYIVGLRQRGLKSSYILFANVLHNCMGAILTIMGLSFGTLIGGSVVTETIFNWQGLGTVVMSAITNRDYPVVQGFVLLISLAYVLINLLTDISYHLLDPRLELK